MNINVRTTTVVEVKTRELFDILSESSLEMLWDDPDSGMGENIFNDLKTIARGDVAGIRQLFRDGYTMMMLPPKAFQVVEAIFANSLQDRAPVEIHLFNDDGNFIGVVTAEDMSY